MQMLQHFQNINVEFLKELKDRESWKKTLLVLSRSKVAWNAAYAGNPVDQPTMSQISEQLSQDGSQTSESTQNARRYHEFFTYLNAKMWENSGMLMTNHSKDLDIMPQV